MTTSIQNLTSFQLNIKSKNNIDFDILPNEIQDIDTKDFLEGTLEITIFHKNNSIWKGFIPIKTQNIIYILDDIILKIDNIIIPNILENHKICKDGKCKNKNKIFYIFIFLFLFIILILIYIKFHKSEKLKKIFIF